MVVNLIILDQNVIWYIQYLQHVVEYVGLGRETNEEQEKDCVEEEFQVARAELNRCDEGTGQV